MRVRLFITALAVTALLLCAQAPAMAIHRSVVVTRGKAWLVDKVPYSQSRYHESYRTDCSGFVSMCWGLTTKSGEPLSLSTRTLPTTKGIASPIASSELLPGDIMVDPGHHTFLFVGWSDLAHSAMITLEEGGTATGTLSRIRSTAGLSSGYHAYRRIGIEADPRYTDHLEFVELAAKLPVAPSRFATAARASTGAFASAPCVVIASADDWTNAITAPALAGTVKGPLLFVSKDAIPSNVVAEIKRLKAKTAYIVGPSTVVSALPYRELVKLGLRVERVGGSNAIRNSAAVMDKTIALIGSDKKTGRRLWDGTLLLANASDRASIQSAASLSARRRWPLLLTKGSTLPTDTKVAISRAKPTRIIVVGGTSVVATATFTALKGRVKTVIRIAGSTSYDTTLLLARIAVASGATWSRVGLAPEGDLADTMAGSVAQTRLGSFMLFTPRRSLAAKVAAVLKTRRVVAGRVRVYGSESAIDYRVRHAAFDALNGSK